MLENELGVKSDDYYQGLLKDMCGVLILSRNGILWKDSAILKLITKRMHTQVGITLRDAPLRDPKH